MNRTQYPLVFVYDNIDGMFTERIKRSVSLHDIRIATGINSSTILNYERGKGNPGKKTYNKLAEFFKWRQWE